MDRPDSYRSGADIHCHHVKRHPALSKQRSNLQNNGLASVESLSGLSATSRSTPRSALRSVFDFYEPINDNRKLFIRIQFDGNLLKYFCL